MNHLYFFKKDREIEITEKTIAGKKQKVPLIVSSRSKLMRLDLGSYQVEPVDGFETEDRDPRSHLYFSESTLGEFRYVLMWLEIKKDDEKEPKK